MFSLIKWLRSKFASFKHGIHIGEPHKLNLFNYPSHKITHIPQRIVDKFVVCRAIGDNKFVLEEEFVIPIETFKQFYSKAK